MSPSATRQVENDDRLLLHPLQFFNFKDKISRKFDIIPFPSVGDC
jgi:hypothetical protein